MTTPVANKISRTMIAAFTLSIVPGRGELMGDPGFEFDAVATNTTDTAVAGVAAFMRHQKSDNSLFAQLARLNSAGTRSSWV
jgi:hypothetical protein